MRDEPRALRSTEAPTAVIWAPPWELLYLVPLALARFGAKLRSAEAWRAEDSATASDDASIFFRASQRPQRRGAAPQAAKPTRPAASHSGSLNAAAA